VPTDNLEVNQGKSGEYVRSVLTGGGVHVPLNGITLQDLNGDWAPVRRRDDAVKVSLENLEAGVAEEATLESIKTGIGDETTASIVEDPSNPANLQELAAGLLKVLRGTVTGKDNDDELRVRVEEQNGDVTVTLGGETVTVDPLPAGSSNIGSVDIDNQSADISTESTLSDLNAAFGDPSDSPEKSETSAASLLAFVKGAV